LDCGVDSVENKGECVELQWFQFVSNFRFNLKFLLIFVLWVKQDTIRSQFGFSFLSMVWWTELFW
jgi:hypothetical protein